MASPSVSTELTVLHRMNTGSCVAPLREGAVAAGNLTINAESGIGFATTANTTVLTGARHEFASSDFMLGQYVTFQLAFRSYDKFRNLKDLADGGMRILFEDSSGNWARFNLVGGDLETSPSVPGVLRTYSSIGVNAGQIFFIDRAATPDASSGSVDYSDLVAFEISFDPAVSTAFDYYIGLLGYASKPVGTRGELANPLKIVNYNSTFANLPSGYRSSKPFAGPEVGFMSATQTPYRCLQGVQIGDGTTATYFHDTNFELAFYASRSAFYAGPLRDDGYCVAVTDTDSTTRGLVVNTPSANCTCIFDTFSIAGVDIDGGDYYIDNVAGSYLQMLDGAIWNAAYFNMRNTLANRVRFNNVSLNIDFTTVANSSQIGLLSAGSRGLVPSVGGGDYGDFRATFNDSNIGNEITIPDTGADATYDLTGIRTEGQTINIHYEGAAHTVTVNLDASVSATWSSAGGIVVPNSLRVLTVNVRDSSNNPVTSVGVYIDEDDGVPYIMRQLSDGSGIATTSYGGPPTTTTLRARKYGYKDYRSILNIGASDIEVTITLIPDPSQI